MKFTDLPLEIHWLIAEKLPNNSLLDLSETSIKINNLLVHTVIKKRKFNYIHKKINQTILNKIYDIKILKKEIWIMSIYLRNDKAQKNRLMYSKKIKTTEECTTIFNPFGISDVIWYYQDADDSNK